jgi:hypothetical protein
MVMNKQVVNNDKKVTSVEIEIPEELYNEILSDERIVDVKGGGISVKNLVIKRLPFPVGIIPIDIIKFDPKINPDSIVMNKINKQIGI